MKVSLPGVMPAIVTPFTRGGGNVDYDKAANVAAHLKKRGVQGIYVAGTTGEGLLMSVDERKRLLDVLLDAVGKSINVVPHVGCLDTGSTIELARHAYESGAPAAAVIVPGFYGYDDVSIKRHFTTVAKAVPKLPILLYDLPSCAKNVLTPENALELANSVENIVGIKESNRDMAGFSRLAAGAPKNFNLINGADEYSFQAYVTGGTGSVSSTANVVPDLFLGIYKNIKAGNLRKAWTFQTKLQTACGLFHYGKMVAYYKEGLKLQGVDAGYVRPPQRELTASEKKKFQKAMETSGLL